MGHPYVSGDVTNIAPVMKSAGSDVAATRAQHYAALAAAVEAVSSDPSPAVLSKPSPEAVDAAMERINQSANFRVELDTANGIALPVITIRDRVTGEIIRQMPPTTFAAVANRMDQMRGMFVEKEA